MKDNTSAFSSGEYDTKIQQTLPFYEDYYTQTIDLIKAVYSTPLKWLDVGSGTGKMGNVVLDSDIDLTRFVFCDSSEEMIRLSKERFQSSVIEFYHCDIRNLPFENEFDVITAIQVFHYLKGTDRETALKRCYEALKENGILISFENYAPFTNTGEIIGLERWKRYQIEQGKTTEEAQKHIERYGKDYFPITLDENRKLMRDCGFTTVELLWLSNMQAGVWGMK